MSTLSCLGGKINPTSCCNSLPLYWQATEQAMQADTTFPAHWRRKGTLYTLLVRISIPLCQFLHSSSAQLISQEALPPGFGF
jgi:hypothetical protein